MKANGRLVLAVALFLVSAAFPRFAGAAGCPGEADFTRADGSRWTCKLRYENSDKTCTYYNSTRASECTRNNSTGGEVEPEESAN